MKVPEGWKLVPVEPTFEMLEVYRKFYRAKQGYMDLSIWKAMLAAAPEPNREPVNEDR